MKTTLIKTILHKYVYISVFALFLTFSGFAFSETKSTETTPPQQTVKITDIDLLAGHYSREGNNGKSAETTGNNIYIKFYPEEWITILYIPYPYASTVNSDTINKALKKVNRESESGSFTRSTFDILEEAATVHVEKYEIVEGQIQFQCGSISPCAIRLYSKYLELIKSGIINEHIIKFDHVTL
jgi:hypothetical protein